MVEALRWKPRVEDSARDGFVIQEKEPMIGQEATVWESLEHVYILDYLGYLGGLLATILIKNLPEATLKELKRLKVELGCRTWAELLAELVESERVISLKEEELGQIKVGVQGFLRLRKAVSSKWTGPPGVIEETRRSRRDETH